MGFKAEFCSFCKFNSRQELYELFEFGKAAMVKPGYRVYPTGQSVLAFNPERHAVAIVKITASIAEITFQGDETTKVEMTLIRRIEDDEAKMLTAFAEETYFAGES